MILHTRLPNLGMAHERLPGRGLLPGLNLFCFVLCVGMGLPALAQQSPSWPTVDGVADDDRPDRRPIRLAAPSRTFKASEDTLPPDTIPLPFFDSFTHDRPEVDSTKWHRSRAIKIHRHTPINPPDFGAAVLDGSNAGNQVYSDRLDAIGLADRLTSHVIDLEGWTEEDSLYLSFFYQRGGRADPPGKFDSLFVRFLLTERATGDTDTLRAASYGFDPMDRGGPFRQVILPLQEPRIFEPGIDFQFQFASYGSLNGYYDIWLIDYVYLNANRSPEDTLYIDRGIQQLRRTPEMRYTAFPHFLYRQRPSVPLPVYNVDVHNFRPSELNENLESRLYFEDAVQPIELAANQTPFVLPANGRTEVRHDFNITFNPGDLGGQLRQDYYIIDAEDRIGSPGLSVPSRGNDTLRSYYEVDSIMAYDDGEIDRAYGLFRAAGFGQVFHFDYPELDPDDKARVPDSLWLKEVCIDFARLRPTLQGFFLTVWLYSDPDTTYRDSSIVIHQQRVVDTLVRLQNCYPIQNSLGEPEEVILRKDHAYVIGLIQDTDTLIGVGLDGNFNLQDQILWNDFGRWKRASVSGTLMIRPWLSDSSITNARAPDSPHAEAAAPSLHIYPNPVSGRTLTLHPPAIPHASDLEVQVLDEQGREVHCHYQNRVRFPYRWTLPVPAGVYFLRVAVTEPNGQVHLFTEKIIRTP